MPFVPCEDLGSGFQLFNAAENDYYVASDEEIGRVIASMIVQFAMNDRPIDWDMGPDLPPCEQPQPTPWRVVRQVGPFVPVNVASWRQREPFNTFTPIKGPFWDRRQSPVGCVPLALAQIMATNEFPRNRSWNGRSDSWHHIRQFSRSGSATSHTGLTIASMLRVIGIEVGAIYARKWTFALPVCAQLFLMRMGYQRVHSHTGWNNHNENNIIRMLDNNKPVFVAALSRIINGHAWVIDGYMIREPPGLRQTLFHCVWGWGGESNGWFISGLFTARFGAHIPNHTHGRPPNSGAGSWTNHNWIFRIITYDLP